MSKPEDIPQDVRKQAWAIYLKRCDEASRLAAEFEEEEVIDLLVTALLAAKAEERQAILEIVETAPLTNRSSEPTASNKIMADWIAAAIRKRGEG